MTRKEILAEIRDRLQAAFGDRYRGAVLYGSEARGEARPDSDIDVLVLLEGPVKPVNDLTMIIDSLFPVQMKLVESKEYSEKIINALPVDSYDYENGVYGLYRNAKAGGVRL